MNKLAIVSTHPIQYNAPLFRLLAETNGLSVKVFYTWSQTEKTLYDPTFQQNVVWDIPLLEGYDFAFVNNTSKKPSSSHRKGIINPTLNKEIQKWGATHLLVYGWNFVSHFRAMRFFKGQIPVWFRGDSTLLNSNSKIKQLIRKRILTVVFKHVDIAFYVGIENKKYYLEFGLKEQQLKFAPHAIDNDRFSINSNIKNQEALQWKKQLNIPENKIVVLFAGKFEPRKNTKFFLSTFIKANKKRLDPLHLVMAGNGPLKQDLLKEANTNPHITFLPFQNQSIMPVVYRLGDVFCLPSISETWGLAVNEAMASSRSCILSSNVGCAEDLIKSGENGFIFESNDQDQLSTILINLDKNELTEMGIKARQSISNWSFQSIVGNMTDPSLLNLTADVGNL
jgi:glycosyltransferase involved in cell wall biosynthesis